MPVGLSGSSSNFPLAGSLGGSRPPGATFLSKGVARGLLISPARQAGLLARFKGRRKYHCSASSREWDQRMLLEAGVVLETLIVSGFFTTTNVGEPARWRNPAPCRLNE